MSVFADSIDKKSSHCYKKKDTEYRLRSVKGPEWDFEAAGIPCYSLNHELKAVIKVKNGEKKAAYLNDNIYDILSLFRHGVKNEVKGNENFMVKHYWDTQHDHPYEQIPRSLFGTGKRISENIPGKNLKNDNYYGCGQENPKGVFKEIHDAVYISLNGLQKQTPPFIQRNKFTEMVIISVQYM